MLQRQCACGGSCPRCQDELGIQTKLKISEPGDKYEQEADRIADEVMRMPEPSVQQKIEPEEEEGIVQRKALSNPTLGSEIPSIVREAVNSSAHPLDSKTRSLMEYRFGHDFSQVRLHIGTKATQSAQAVGALAYTLGHHIVVDADRYAPETAEGQRLLAHELVHVLQQSPLILENGTFEVTPGAEQLQRAIPQGLVIAAGIIAAIAACASPWYFYAMRTYSGKTDKWRHCYVSCQMSKTCGPILTELAGLGKEIRDRAVAAYCGDNQTSWLCQGGHGDFLDSLRDLAANQTCIAWEAAIVGPLARLWRESCFDCCNRAGL
ncbi:MAG: DUF4157 domain-containing protein [Oscillatoriaceae cyanobacterium Prado104]|jgi:hypothetical protein|nr:DUF4157 domain-containing protein [Oscillatoriaceae cyanobacterium Prado104]